MASVARQLQVYLDEFAFRHNRRRKPTAAFQTLLGLGAGRAPDAVPTDSGRSGRGGQRLIATYWGQLKQPDKQKRPRHVRRAVGYGSGGACSPGAGTGFRQQGEGLH